MKKGKRFGNWRWLICAGVFVVVVINFVDRQSFSVATPTIARDLNLTNEDVAIIAIAFSLAFYPGMVFWGKLMDFLGCRTGMAIAVIWWSLAEALTGSARSVAAFSAYRFLLGLGEAGIGPGTVKVASEWFGIKERTSAIGFYTTGATMASVIGAPLIAIAVVHVGWQWAFVLAGTAGLGWLFPWLVIYQPPARHPYVSEEERALIQADMAGEEATSAGAPEGRSIGWSDLFRHKQMWGLVLARLFTEPLALTLPTFLPKYMVEQRGFEMISMGFTLSIPAVFGTVGLLTGGFLAGRMLGRGIPLRMVRKRLLVLGLLLQTAVVPAVLNADERVLVSLLVVVSFGSGIWSANINALVTDIVPKYLVGSAYGIAAFGAGVAGSIYLKIAGTLADSTKSLTPVFLGAGAMPILSIIAVVWLLGGVGRLRVGAATA